MKVFKVNANEGRTWGDTYEALVGAETLERAIELFQVEIGVRELTIDRPWGYQMEGLTPSSGQEGIISFEERCNY